MHALFLLFIYVVSHELIIKKLLDEVFVVSRIIKVQVELSAEAEAEADNPYQDLYYSGYHKRTEFNNCFIIH